MKLNWMAYQYRNFDGYGRFSNRFISALVRAGAEVHPMLCEMAYAPISTQRTSGMLDALTIQCAPVFYTSRGCSPMWLYSMTEGSELPDGWAEIIASIMPERVIVPCEYNAKAFRDGMQGLGMEIPVSIINGGTDPAEFDCRPTDPPCSMLHTYTFMALADRGARKGWTEVWQAFYKAFGSPEDTPDVRLIIKSRPAGKNAADADILESIANALNPDPRVTVWAEDVDDMRDVWDRADCVTMPSRSEGFGMPHREAAMTGVPVITQCYSGMDDGFLSHWAIVIPDGKIERIPSTYAHIKGEWMKANIPELARAMTFCYKNRRVAHDLGIRASEWLGDNQTWDHSARALMALIEENGYGTDYCTTN